MTTILPRVIVDEQIEVKLAGLKQHRDQEKKHRDAADILRGDLLEALDPYVQDFDEYRFQFGRLNVLITESTRASISREDLKDSLLGLIGETVTIQLVDQLIAAASRSSTSWSLRVSKAAK